MGQVVMYYNMKRFFFLKNLTIYLVKIYKTKIYKKLLSLIKNIDDYVGLLCYSLGNY